MGTDAYENMKWEDVKCCAGIHLEEYEQFVLSLASERSIASEYAKVCTGGLGLAGEAGEVADLAKKIVFHGMDFTDEVRQKLLSELSDCMWYIAFTARAVLGVGIQQVIDENVRKLTARYPTGKFRKEDFMLKENRKTITEGEKQ